MYSLMGMKAKALEHLETAIILEPKFKKLAPTDKDFKNIQDDEKFQKIIDNEKHS